MLVVGSRFLPEGPTPRCGQAGDYGGVRRGVQCHRGPVELGNAGWWRVGPGRNVSGDQDVGLVAQVPYWSKDFVASGGRLTTQQSV